MPERSECCGAKTYPLFIKRGLSSRVENHGKKSPFKKAGYFCLRCGSIHIGEKCQRRTKHMITVYNKRPRDSKHGDEQYRHDLRTIGNHDQIP